MTVERRTHDAAERARAESERVQRKVEAFESFARRVEEIRSDGGGGRQISALGAGASGTRSEGNALAVRTTNATNIGAVRDAFRETVYPYADADSMREALADELSPDLASALSPAASGVTTALKRRLCSRAEERQRECRLLADGIETERDRLREVGDELDAVTEWLAEADETPLLQLGFEALRERHDRLAEHREACERLAERRQATLRGAQHDGLTGIRERELRDHLYGGFDADNPVLADVAELDSALDECQRAVRNHLCARV